VAAAAFIMLIMSVKWLSLWLSLAAIFIAAAHQ
jgi:hypothetical protein